MKDLEKTFIGIGEVKGFLFQQISKNDFGYLYSVAIGGSIDHYEVFLKDEQKEGESIIAGRKVIFENKILYPSSNKFGISAWTFKTYKESIESFENLCLLTKEGLNLATQI